MKALYWHRHTLPRMIMIAYCLFALLGLWAVEYFKETTPQPYFEEKLKAAMIANEAIQSLTKQRQTLSIPIDRSLDPAGTGLIGEQLTPITTDQGILFDKQDMINPNIAAQFVVWLKRANVKPGDTIAIAMTGSFPGLDISVLAAMKALNLKPLIIISDGASQYGANIPNFTWVDMYHHLQQKNIFPWTPLAVSLGGKDDDGLLLSPEGKDILQKTIQNTGYPILSAKTLQGSINERMVLYHTASKKHHIAAYINIGGGAASIGLKRVHREGIESHVNHKPLAAGLVTAMPVSLAYTDSVAVRFLKQGVPVINAHNIHSLLIRNEFPERMTHLPAPGKGGIFYHAEYNTWLAVGVLTADILVFIFIAWISKRRSIRYKPY